MKIGLACTVMVCAIAGSALGGQLTEKVDRFKGTKTLSWESFRDQDRGYSFNVYAHFSTAADSAPYGYYSLLVPPRGTESFAACHQNHWLVDGIPAPELEAAYSTPGQAQIFRSTLTRQALEKISRAKTVEFKICNTEGSVSASDLDGLRQLLDATN